MDMIIFATALRQHGVFTRAQALAAGFTPRQTQLRLSRGEWLVTMRGVYRMAGTPLTYEGRVMAACLGTGGVASYGTAAELHGLPVIPDFSKEKSIIEVSRRPGEPKSGADVRGHERSFPNTLVHRPRALDSVDISKRGHVPVTTVARTVLDLTTTVGRSQTIGLIDNAINSRQVTRSHLHRRSVVLENGRRNGSFASELTNQDSAAIFRSWLERRAADVFRAAGLPPPEWNALVTAAGQRYEFDAWWPLQLLDVELDGAAFHSTPRQLQRDRQRDRNITLAGILVLRFAYHDILDHPDEVIKQIRQALNRPVGAVWHA